MDFNLLRPTRQGIYLSRGARNPRKVVNPTDLHQHLSHAGIEAMVGGLENFVPRIIPLYPLTPRVLPGGSPASGFFIY